MLGQYIHNSERKDRDAYREIEGMVAHRYNVLRTDFVEYVLLVPVSPMKGFSSWYSYREKYHDVWLGDFMTVDLPPELEALPEWTSSYWPEERIRRVEEWRAMRQAEAERLIKAAFPEDFRSPEEKARELTSC